MYGNTDRQKVLKNLNVDNFPSEVSGFDSVCAMLDKSCSSPRSVLAGVVIALAASLLSACAPAGPALPGDELPTVVPLFASDEEALNAAVEIYRQYLYVSDLIMQDGGADPERIEPYASGQALEFSNGGFETFSYENIRASGFNQIQNTLFQQQKITTEGTEVYIYSCNDISEVDVHDTSGKTILNESRAFNFVMLAGILFQSASEGKVVYLEVWNEKALCDEA